MKPSEGGGGGEEGGRVRSYWFKKPADRDLPLKNPKL